MPTASSCSRATVLTTTFTPVEESSVRARKEKYFFLLQIVHLQVLEHIKVHKRAPIQFWEHIQAPIRVWEHIQASIQVWEHIKAPYKHTCYFESTHMFWSTYKLGRTYKRLYVLFSLIGKCSLYSLSWVSQNIYPWLGGVTFVYYIFWNYILYPYKNKTRDLWANIPHCLREFPRPNPKAIIWPYILCFFLIQPAYHWQTWCSRGCPTNIVVINLVTEWLVLFLKIFKSLSTWSRKS